MQWRYVVKPNWAVTLVTPSVSSAKYGSPRLSEVTATSDGLKSRTILRFDAKLGSPAETRTEMQKEWIDCQKKLATLTPPGGRTLLPPSGRN